MAPRVDNRLADTPMVSVQWNAEAVARCPELGSPVLRGPFLPGCSRMSEFIREAALAGRIPVPAEVPAETANS
ncbi:Uncharacterised protein [Mycobacteroides abscessus subsp. abscessus]|nr:Uncharacterised protein [Mycobacteroides abscessus subsp. abscessus]